MVTFHVLDGKYTFPQLQTCSANCSERFCSSNIPYYFSTTYQFLTFLFLILNEFPFPWISIPSSLILDVVLHYQLNAFKIPKMVLYNRSLMISVIDPKYIPLQSKSKVIHLLPIFRKSFSYCKLNQIHCNLILLQM